MRISRTRGGALLTVCVVTMLAAAACGGGGDEGSKTVSSATKSPAVGTPQVIDGSPFVGKTPGAQTPGAAATPAPSTAAGSATLGAPGNTPSSFEATLVVDVGEDVLGGDPSDPRVPVGDIPTPPAGATVDSGDVALPDNLAESVQIIVDMDAAAPGVQASRTVHVGDVFRVAIIVANVPASGLNSFNFYLNYDKARVFAPSYTGGATTDRNPDMYEAGLGDGWTCIPAPEGDLDDPGGINGDGVLETGRALLSCFNISGALTGSLVVATIEFHAVAAGLSQMILNTVALGGLNQQQFAQCEDDAATGSPIIPCLGGSVTVQ